MNRDVTIWTALLTALSTSIHVFAQQDLHMVKNFQDNNNWFFQLLHPHRIGYTYKIRPAKDFGGILNQSYVNIELIPTEPLSGCTPITNGVYIKNNIAFSERGDCSFMEKAINAENVGATAIIIMDNDHDNDGRFIDMIDDGTKRQVTIPAFFILGKDGFMILKTMEELRLLSVYITIPINATGIPLHMLNQPPWTLW